MPQVSNPAYTRETIREVATRLPPSRAALLFVSERPVEAGCCERWKPMESLGSKDLQTAHDRHGSRSVR
jgi:hypothetical protein